MMAGKPSTSYPASNAAMAELPHMEHGHDSDEDRALMAQIEARASEAAAINAVWMDKFREQVAATLGARFERNTFTEMALASGISTRHNPMRDAVRRAAEAVWPSSQVVIERTDEQGKTTVDNDPRWNKLVQAINPDKLMAEAGAMGFILHTYLWPSVTYDERTGLREFSVRILTPDQFFVKESKHNPTKWCALYLLGHKKLRDGTMVRTLERWDRHTIQHFYYRNGDTLMTPDGAEENTWHVVPGAFVRYSDNCLWGPTFGDAFSQSTIQANVSQSLLTLAGNHQGKVLMGVFDKMPAHTALKPHMGTLPLGSAGTENVSLQDMSTNTPQFATSYITNEPRMCCTTLGLQPDEFEVSLAPPSGESLRLRYFGRQETAKKRRPALIEALKETILTSIPLLVTAVQQTGQPVGQESGERPDGDDVLTHPPVRGFKDASSLPPYDESVPLFLQPFNVRVDVGDVQYPETQAERVARLTFETQRGFTTWPDEFQRHNPDTMNPAADLMKNIQVNVGVERLTQRARGVSQPFTPGGVPPGNQQPAADASPATTQGDER